MIATRARALFIVLIAASLAGCATGDKNGGAPPPGTSPTAGGPPQGGNVSSISVVSTPSRAAAGAPALVCWQVEGTGTIPHTAVHFDTQSHPEATSFQAYVGGAAYPDNATAQARGGYSLPGTFCTNVPVPETGPAFFRAHALDARGPPGMLSDEHAISASGTATSTAVLTSPFRAAPGADALVCWRVEGTGNIAHTAVHFDAASHPDPATFQSYKGGAAYPDNQSSQATAGYNLPGNFCTNVKMPSQGGDLYFRAHAMDARGAPGVMSVEERIRAAGQAASVSVMSAPAAAAAGTRATVCWRVEGSGNVAHTALHFDTQSHPNATSFQDYQAGAAYPNNQTGQASAGYRLPGTFCAGVPMPATGAVYLRAHVIDRTGGAGKMSPETRIDVA